jgi:NADPH-dependent glutamate synthase beta subunit-like oxidoreductase/NAD(P)H-flavin reductase
MLKNYPKLKFEDFYDAKGIKKVDAEFCKFFKQNNHELYQKFCKNKQDKVVLIDSAKVLEDFIVDLFDVKKENDALKNEHFSLQKIYEIKREFVQRIVAKKYKEIPEGFKIKGLKILKDLNIKQKNIDEIEISFAKKVANLLGKKLDKGEEELYEKLVCYSVWALYDEGGKKFHQDGALFILPQKIDYDNLVENSDIYKERDGFNLLDHGFSLNKALSEANYCIFCHNQDKDSCRTGLCDNKTKKFKQNPLEITLEGCPLDQKISEMNLLKSEAFSIASIAVATIDNPLMAGTGHRICNDCMKSCIFQKQDPVNIPQIETRALKDVLSLPYGFEIYSLLTRWNPLKQGDELIKKNSGRKILVAGLGPAGYVLSHYLSNEGHNVVAIDGLKIEPLNEEISGIDAYGNRKKFKPIKSLDEIYEPLSKRLIQGFGGVAEYGITSRWDKNFLTIIRLLLERKRNFRMFGGLRFGSSVTEKNAFEEYGFDHIALCIGAGKPNIIDIKNNFAKGVRSSSDFLMALQLTGAFKEDLLTNLQLRLPIIVIGAGLTAIDTACEAQEYYISQIKKFHKKFQDLCQKIGEKAVLSQFNQEERLVVDEFLAHFLELKEIGKEKFVKKYHAKILYRKKIQDSPAYRLNHEELIKAFEQGVEFIQNQEPKEAILDDFGHIKALKCKNDDIFECKSLLVAAGTSPNLSPTIYDGFDAKIDEKYFAQIDENGQKIKPTNLVKHGNYSFFIRKDKKISFFGDLHPNFEGNVVKAMASAKIGYKKISQNLKPRKFPFFYDNFNKINRDFVVKIAKIVKISPFLNEIHVKAPLLAKNTKIGQIFRLQNYHAFAPRKNNALLAMEGVAVTALGVENDVIKGIVLDYGGSTGFIKNFKSNEPCVFMGPGGEPTEIAKNETVLLIGGGRGNMPLCAIGSAMKKNNCKVIFCAGYKNSEFIARQKNMQKASDVLIYAVEEAVSKVKLKRKNDKKIQGNVAKALTEYFKENPQKIDRVFAIGSDKMMAEIARIRHEKIIPEIANAKIAITSLNASMQCMMKGICSQCLQKRTLENGKEEYFYACASQDQNMDRLNFKHLSARCDQNSTQEKITRLWIQNFLT